MHTFGFVWEALYKLQYKKIRSVEPTQEEWLME